MAFESTHQLAEELCDNVDYLLEEGGRELEGTQCILELGADVGKRTALYAAGIADGTSEAIAAEKALEEGDDAGDEGLEACEAGGSGKLALVAVAP